LHSRFSRSKQYRSSYKFQHEHTAFSQSPTAKTNPTNFARSGGETKPPAQIRRPRLLLLAFGVLAALGVGAAPRGLRRLPGSLLLQRLGVPLPPLLRREPVVAPLGRGPPRLRPLPVALPLVAACSPPAQVKDKTATSSETHRFYFYFTTENIKRKKNLAETKRKAPARIDRTTGKKKNRGGQENHVWPRI